MRDVYEHSRRLSIPNGLWFCTPVEGMQTFMGWAIPPFTIPKDFSIRANGVPCQTEPVEDIPLETQEYFDRFGIGELSSRYVFRFVLPLMPACEDIVLTCQFSETPASVFYSFFRSHGAEIETPAFNILRVMGSDNEEHFRLIGYTQYRHLKAMVEAHRPGSAAILDWGCGAARVLRHFAGDPRWQVVGVDVDAYNVRWCQQTLGDTAAFHVIDPMARCPFRDGSFDVVYGISVFTHLGRESERFWLAELHRLLKPGGLAVMTVHGEMTFFKAINDFPTYCCFVRDGFLDVGACLDLSVAGRPTISEELYRNVFHTRPHLERVWGQHFSIVDYIPGGATAHQDYVVMVRT